MPVTVRGTDILFNDGSTQSTAGGAVNTTSVLNATAGLAIGAVGSYAFLQPNFSSPQSAALQAANAPNSTRAGSTLFYTNSDRQPAFGSGSPAGTWRCLGRSIVDIGLYGETVQGSGTLFVRIS